MAEPPGLIETRELTKRFGDKVAVDHLSFTVEPGRVTGFLGPNGAGKCRAGSTLWSLLVFVVVAIGFSALVAAVISNTWNNPGNHPNHVTLLTDPTAVLFGAGFGLGQLAMCVLGVIVISSEYSTGAIRSSLLAVPRRIPLLAAKAVIFALLDFVVSAITVFAVFFISTAILRSHISITLSTTGVTRVCIGGILYLTVLGLFSLAIGGPRPDP